MARILHGFALLGSVYGDLPVYDGPVCPLTETWPPIQVGLDIDQQHCSASGVSNVTKYLYGLPLEQGGVFPYFSSLPLDATQKQVKTAVIWIHGLFGNANKFFCDGLALTKARGADATTLTLAPWFSNVSIPASTWGGAAGASSTCWNGSKWQEGGDDLAADSSAFAALDQLVAVMRNGTGFPALEQIVIAGFSAGCQMASRWAFFSNATLAKPATTPVTVIVGDCGSYMYLDKRRPAKSCSALKNTGPTHTCADFEVPGAAETNTAYAECPAYDEYKYGLNLKRFHETKYRENNGYIQHFADTPALIQKSILDFPTKDFRILLGDSDACMCNVKGFVNDKSCFPTNTTCGTTLIDGCCDTYPDSDSVNALAHTCHALLGGSIRLQRGLNYISYLETFYHKLNASYRPVFATFSGAHDSTAWGSSDEFAKWVGWTMPASVTTLV